MPAPPASETPPVTKTTNPADDESAGSFVHSTGQPTRAFALPLRQTAFFSPFPGKTVPHPSECRHSTERGTHAMEHRTHQMQRGTHAMQHRMHWMQHRMHWMEHRMHWMEHRMHVMERGMYAMGVGKSEKSQKRGHF